MPMPSLDRQVGLTRRAWYDRTPSKIHPIWTGMEFYIYKMEKKVDLHVVMVRKGLSNPSAWFSQHPSQIVENCRGGLEMIFQWRNCLTASKKAPATSKLRVGCGAESRLMKGEREKSGN